MGRRKEHPFCAQARYRCEYALMGASVNLAARLMASCELGSDDIRVDHEVYQQCRQRFAFEKLRRIRAKALLTLLNRVSRSKTV